MISKELAGYLLNYYKNALHKLQTHIDENLRRSIKGQNEIIPYIISALELIIKGKVFTSTSNPSQLLAFDNDPQVGLIKIFKDRYFEHECNRYLKDQPQLLEKLNNLSRYFTQAKPEDISFFQNFRETDICHEARMMRPVIPSTITFFTAITSARDKNSAFSASGEALSRESKKDYAADDTYFNKP